MKLALLLVWGLVHIKQLVAEASANYVCYDGYSSVDFDNATGVFVPTDLDCLALSDASPMTNGIVYNNLTKVCKVLTALNNEILVTLHVNADWTTYVKDISARSVMVFKVQAAQTANHSAMILSSAFKGVGAAYTKMYSAAVASVNTSASCNCTYRSPFIDWWNTSQVSIGIVSQGISVASITFDAIGSNMTSWMTTKKIIAAAPYSLSKLRLTNFSNDFGSSYSCGANKTQVRDFSLWTKATSNCTDCFYIMATSETTCCAFAESPSPTILVSLTATESCGNAVNLLRADYLVLSVKVVSRVIKVP